ncbi:hypothetical protein ACFXG4_35950 [Nocardia sp. NPDC059246]
MSDQESTQDTAAAEGIAAMMAVWDLEGSDDAKARGDVQDK